MNTRLQTWSLVVLLSLWLLESPSQSSTLDQGQPGFSTSFRSVEKDSMDAHSILNESWDTFVPSSDVEQNFGYSQQDLWFRVQFDRTQGFELLYLEVAYALLDIVDVYYVDEKRQIVREFHSGDHRVFGSRPLKTPTFVFPVSFAHESSIDVLIKIHSSGSLYVPFRLWTPEQLFEQKSQTMQIQGIFFGAILAVLFYNFFICVLTRSWTYFLYVGLVFSIANVYFVLRGFSFQYLWANSPHWVDVNMLFSGACSEAFVVGFSAHFLKVWEDSRKLYLLSKLITGFFLLLALTTFFVPYTVLVKPVVVLATLSVGFSMMLGIRSLILRRPHALYYVISWTIFILGTVLYALSNFGWIPSNPFTTHAMQIGSACEIMFLSFVLGARFNGLQRENRSLIERLRDYINTIEIIVAEKTQSIRSIMENIKLGIFTIQPQNLRIGDEHSRFLDDLFGQPPTLDQEALDFLFDHGNVNRDSVSAARQALHAMLGETSLSFEFNQHSLIREFTRQDSEGRRRSFELDWSPIVNSQQIVERILVTCKDVTELQDYRQKDQMRSQELEYIAELIGADAEHMRIFFELHDDIIVSCQKTVNLLDDLTPELLRNLFIDIHTLKGSARTLCLKRLAESAHDFETVLSGFSTYFKGCSTKSLIEGFQVLRLCYDSYRQINFHQLNRQELDVSNKRISCHQFLADVISGLPRLARDLGKPNPLVEIDLADVKLTTVEASALRQAFVHIIRNAMDHGIETAEERLGIGKSERARLHISVQPFAMGLYIIFRDDGRGLDLVKIEKVARERLILDQSKEYDLATIASCIFNAGFSTSANLTSISGRGIGMSAIKKHLSDIQGQVMIELLDLANVQQVPFQLRVTLPRSTEFKNQSDHATAI